MTPAAQVLVIDDDVDIRTMIRDLLEDEGYTVALACNGAEAIALLEQWSPELPALILMDMRMPVMDGWEFAHAFHQRWGYRTPILVMSAGTDVGVWAHEAGAQGLIRKPFELTRLLTLVARFCAQRSALAG